MSILKHVDFEVPNFGELAVSPLAVPSYSSAVVSLNPVAYWRLGEQSGRTLADEMGPSPRLDRIDFDSPLAVLHAGARQLVLAAYWTASLRTMGIDLVQLVAQSGSNDPITLGKAIPATGQHRVVFTIDRPAVPTRYRFISAQGASSFESPWSAEVLPADAPSQSLTLLEASS